MQSHPVLLNTTNKREQMFESTTDMIEGFGANPLKAQYVTNENKHNSKHARKTKSKKRAPLLQDRENGSPYHNSSRQLTPPSSVRASCAVTPSNLTPVQKEELWEALQAKAKTATPTKRSKRKLSQENSTPSVTPSGYSHRVNPLFGVQHPSITRSARRAPATVQKMSSDSENTTPMASGSRPRAWTSKRGARALSKLNKSLKLGDLKRRIDLDSEDSVPSISLPKSKQRPKSVCLGGKRSHRECAIDELLESEFRYRERLGELIVEIIVPLKGRHDIMSEEEHACVFRNVEELYSKSTAIVDMLTQGICPRGVRTENPELVGVLDGVLKLLPRYRTYLSTYSQSGHKVQEILNRSSALADFFARQKIALDQFYSFMAEPMQRITRYPLLYEAIVRHTCKDHSEYVQLKREATECKVICQKINKSVALSESKVMLEQLESMLCERGRETFRDYFGEKPNCLVLGDAFVVDADVMCTRIFNSAPAVPAPRASRPYTEVLRSARVRVLELPHMGSDPSELAAAEEESSDLSQAEDDGERAIVLTDVALIVMFEVSPGKFDVEAIMPLESTWVVHDNDPDAVSITYPGGPYRLVVQNGGAPPLKTKLRGSASEWRKLISGAIDALLLREEIIDGRTPLQRRKLHQLYYDRGSQSIIVNLTANVMPVLAPQCNSPQVMRKLKKTENSINKISIPVKQAVRKRTFAPLRMRSKSRK